MKSRETTVLAGYEPQVLFGYLEAITKIPRGSGNEAGIATFLETFARERGLPCYRDAMHNVLITCPGTPGYETAEPVLLQGHTDMVCEKNAGTVFDFETDPLSIYVDEAGFLRARGTTLGADDGVAVAMMLALLDGASDAHPPLECLFTVQEETGLCGAGTFDYSRLKARKLINLDSENDGEVIVGCAGGVRSDIAYSFATEPAAGAALRVSITGLCGGHSGENINSGRANAHKLMGRLLLEAADTCSFRIACVNGGSKDNAIPRECEAILVTEEAARLTQVLTERAARIAAELSKEDAAFAVQVTDVPTPNRTATAEATQTIVLFLASVPCGVLAMSQNIPGLVAFSRNLGVVRTEGTTIHFTLSSRSAIESQLDFSVAELDAIAARMGASIHHHGRYPGWDYETVSPLRDRYFAVYEALFGQKPQASMIHAGLECGVIKSRVPDMDMISIGPAMRDIHSPDEALDLASFGRLWRLVCEMLR